MNEIQVNDSPRNSHPWGAQFLASIIGILVLVQGATEARSSQPATDEEQARLETRFMTEMIDHHAMGVEMAKLCDERAVHEELKALCTRIKESQTEQIKLMQLWLQQWYGISHEPHMSEADRREIEHLASHTGAVFEKDFLEKMIEHHAMAARRSVDPIEKAFHDELVHLALRMSADQLSEIHTMRHWLCQWYNSCRLGTSVENTQQQE